MSSTYYVIKRQSPAAPERESLRAKMESEGYDVFQWSDPPGAIYEMHEHPEDQSHCIVSGRLELTIENEEPVVLHPGDRDFMPAGTRHSARVPGDEPVVYLIGSKT